MIDAMQNTPQDSPANLPPRRNVTLELSAKALNVSDSRELLFDDFLLAEREGLDFRLHEPVALPADPEKPCGAYVTLLGDDRRFLLFSRGFDSDYKGPRHDGNPGEFTEVAESPDGLHWRKPDLNRFPGRHVPPNTLFSGTPFTHNFTPFYDRNPACPPQERYKAVAGFREAGGLFAFHSADGFNWIRDDERTPIVAYAAEAAGGHLLDSQNVAFYSPFEKRYVLYYRVWRTADGRTGLRSFAKSVSDDFRHWSEPEFIGPNREGEHLYVSGLAPYARAPQYYVGAATRFFEERGAATDVTLLFSRHGKGVQRPFPGVWIRPGLDPSRWGNRMNYIAWGIAQTSPGELTLYHGHKHIRYALRTDGFTSLAAGVDEGSFLTKPLLRGGGGLELNLSTSAAGFFRLEVCDLSGAPLPGFTFEDFGEFYGDRIAFRPQWGGRGLETLPPGPFRLRARLRECDLYSLAFDLGG